LARASWDRWLVAPALLVSIAALVGSYTRTAWVITGIAIVVLGAVRFHRLLQLDSPPAAAGGDDEAVSPLSGGSLRGGLTLSYPDRDRQAPCGHWTP